MPAEAEAKVVVDVVQVENLVHMIESGSHMVQQLWGNVSEFKKVSAEFDAFKREIKDMLPNKDSWKHPEKAREALREQLDYAERTLIRNTLDFVDAKRDALTSQLQAAGVANHKVTVPGKHGPAEVPLHKVLEDHHTAMRMSILRHMNAYFRNVRYYTEILITGGEIPLFALGSGDQGNRLDQMSGG